MYEKDADELKWIIDPLLFLKMKEEEILFHKVLPFSKNQDTVFLFSSSNSLSVSQVDFLEEKFPGLLFVNIYIENLNDIYHSYSNNENILGLGNHILFQGILKRASDIHFESCQEYGRIRFRVDGDLFVFKEVDLNIWPQLINRMKILAGLRLDDHKHPQMGRHTVFLADKEIDLRFSSHPTVFGESIVIRILDKQLKPLNIDELDFEKEFCEALKDLLKIPYGLIIFTGPTGSGKTTSLFSLLSYIKSDRINIMTLEDPVEYVLDGAKQTEIKPGTIDEWSDGIRSILRQDPDVILIGEMRDEETARMAFRASMTGHTVFSTLHANNVFQVIQRLSDLNVPSSLVCGNLRGVVSQRLVRKICEGCGGDGCDICANTGFYGRIPVGEILKIDSNLDEMICQNMPLPSMEKYALSCGFISIKDYALSLVQKNLTTLEEVQKIL